MSHSQFHCIDLFILRHAWLNLWDKHMTTGRINQVSYKEFSGADLMLLKDYYSVYINEAFTPLDKLFLLND
jgi:hypothetical protein